MAEWLTRWFAKPDLSGCVGSNPARSVLSFKIMSILVQRFIFKLNSYKEKGFYC